MSGIFGHIGEHPRSTPLAIVSSMADSLRHAPAQATEVSSVRPDVAIGRLSLGIFNPEQQPVVAARGPLSLWMVGEFYHQQPRRNDIARHHAQCCNTSDADLAMAVYLAEGTRGLTSLQGAFLVVIWDERASRLTLVNDRFGLYPHYYASDSRTFSFAPKMMPLLHAPAVTKCVDPTAIAEYVRFQQLLGERTWLSDVHLLPPASILTFRLRECQLKLERYWDWDEIPSLGPISFGEAVQETVRLLQRSVDARTQSAHRLGIYLSGGMDSRTLLGFVDDRLPVTTITYGDERCWDVVYSARLAELAGSNHHWFPMRDGQWVLEHAPLHLKLTEGMHSWLHAHGISTLQPVSELVEVVLTGWDGGILSGLAVGTDRERDHYFRTAPDDESHLNRMFEAFCYGVTWPGVTEAEAHGLLADPALPALAYQSFRHTFVQTHKYRPDRRSAYLFMQQHNLRSTINMVVFARSAFEVRCPFWDDDLISFVFGLPDEIWSVPGFYANVLYRRAPLLTSVPYDKDNRLPTPRRFPRYRHAALQRAERIVRHRMPHGMPDRPWLYADYEEYLRTDLRGWAEDCLFGQRARNRGLFRQEAVRSLWDRHLSRKELLTVGKLAPIIEVERVMRMIDDA